MSEFLSGEGYANALLWTLAALALLLLVLFAVRKMRGLNTGSLLPGGRGRMARLGVVEATVVDNQRRLVLVRRDNVEHLIMIGGPSDLVVEQKIQNPAALRQPPKAPARQAPAATERPPAPSAAPEAPAQAAASRAQTPSSPPKPAERQEPKLGETPAVPAAGQSTVRPAQDQAGTAREKPTGQENEEEALLKHVDLSISEIRNVSSADRPEESIDDEMSRLLDDISENKDRR